MGNQSDFDLTRGNGEGPRKTGSVSQIRERVRPASPWDEGEDHDPIQHWDTRNARSLQVPAPLNPPATSPATTQERTDAFSLEATPDPAPPSDDGDARHRRQEIRRAEKDSSPAGRAVSIDHPRTQPKRLAWRHSLTGFCLAALAVITIGAVTRIAGHNAAHTGTSGRVKAAASRASISTLGHITPTLARDASATITSITADATKVARVHAAAQAKASTARAAARKARARRARARAARVRRRRQAAARAHRAAQASSTPASTSQSPASRASTTSTYTPPAAATSAPAQASGSPSQATTSSSHTPAGHPFGAGGLLGAGSSPSG